MKNTKIYIAAIFSLILILTPAYARAEGSNDFTANLSVSDTLVTAGTTVTCTITVTNTDTTYGADVAISYNGQVIDSYYLNAGKSEISTHNITINKTTDVYYTVYASHGPDISKTKNTNTVTVYVESPATATPTHTPSVESAETITPTPSIAEEIAPDVTPYIETDDDLGWGAPIKIENSPTRVMDNLFKESFGDWLGANQEILGDYKYIYTMRKIISAIILLIVLSLIVFIIVAVRVIKK